MMLIPRHHRAARDELGDGYEPSTQTLLLLY